MSQTKTQLVEGLNINTSAPATALQIDASGNINLDSNTLYVDATNNRVGLGTSSPSEKLTINEGNLRLTSTDTFHYVGLQNTSTGGRHWILANAGASDPNGVTAGNLYLRDSTAGANRIAINSSGNVGIGTTSPSQALHVVGKIAVTGTNPSIQQSVQTANLDLCGGTTIGTDSSIQLYASSSPSDANHTFYNSNVQIWRNTAGTTQYGRFDSSGRLLVGTSTSSGFAAARMIINSAGTDATGSANLVLQVGEENSTITANEQIGSISFGDESGYTYASIQANADLAAGSDSPGRLVFSTTADGASSPTERMRISSGGQIKTTADSNTTIFYTNSLNSASTGFSFYFARSGNDSDTEFNLRGDGTGLCDGSWNGGGADYAEYFEWSDGNPDAEDRRGISVVLDGEKIRPAVEGEDPIGVISGNPSVVGDAAWNKWNGKHLRDDYGTYILNENGERQLNPAYDPDVEYISREDRPEWDCVGLMGKLRIRKGQPTGSRWIKMRDISDSVEEWLVR